MHPTLHLQQSRKRAKALAVLLMAACVFLLPGQRGHAADGRDFAGFYEATNVTDLGTEVSLTLAVRIFNYSGADIENGVVAVAASVEERDFGTYAGVYLADHANIRLAADFTISREEYDRWQNGNTPMLRIEYQQNGNSIHRMVELLALPVGEE
jgi:hypothetical protein